MSKYTYAKKNIPDWDEHISADLKTQIKAFCLKKVLLKADRVKIMEQIAKEITEFIDEFDSADEAEKQIGERYRQELTEFATEAYEKAVSMVGNLTPYMFAQGLAKPEMLTQVQKDQLGRAKGVTVGFNASSVENILKDTPSTAEGGYNRGIEAGKFYGEVHKELKAGMRDYTEFRQSASRPYLISVNQRNVVEMGIRFKAYQDRKKKLIADGVRLVYVPPHANCSKRCQPYQGKLYSLDGSRGSVDGRSYVPIEEAADNITVTGKRDTSRVYAAGLFSYNCRHTMEPYEEGQNFEVIPDEVIEKQRKIETEQRRLEREIRALREKHMLYHIVLKTSNNKNLKSETYDIWKLYLQKREEYYAFCDKNKIPQFGDRLKVISGENLYQRTSGKRDSRVKDIKISP